MNYYCAIYTMINVNYNELVDKITTFNSGTVKGHYINNNVYELRISKNDEYNEILSKSFPNGFLYFNYKFEIIPKTKIHTRYKQYVANLLQWLWENDFPAVAACDFENELPNRGGYNNKKIPWP